MKQKTTESAEYIQSLDKIPFDKFVDCYCDGNLSALVLKGFPDQSELTRAWDGILNEYVEQIATNEYKLYLSLYRDISQLRITLLQIESLVGRANEATGRPPGLLRLMYNEHLESEINGLLNTNYKLNPSDPKTYYAIMDKMANRASGLKIRLDLMLARFEALEKKNAKAAGVKADRAYFTSVLVVLSDDAGYHLPENILMSAYCIRLKRLLSKQKNG